MRMLGPKGNPQARNLFEIIAHLQKSVSGNYFTIFVDRLTVQLWPAIWGNSCLTPVLWRLAEW
jgi:hypothetical protein